MRLLKIFHTADWHLGKYVQGVSMIEDQAYILQQFIAEIDKEKPDVIIIAGDLYDRAVPPTEAVQLLDNIFFEIVIKREIPVLAIAGNHDSPNRIHFGARFMASRGLHLIGNLTLDQTPVILKDDTGEVHFHLVPYTDPTQVRYLFQDPAIRTQQQAMEKIIDSIVPNMDPKARHIFIGHAFVTKNGAEEQNPSDAERPLSIGGSECIDAKLFEPFHYTALGHLHQAHFVDSEKIRYSGSPLKYSISEENHKKSYLIVEIDGAGQITTTKKPLMPKRDMRTIENTMEQILVSQTCEDYLFIKLLDESPIISPMEKIRSVYPNAMHVERISLLDYRNKPLEENISKRKMDDVTLFESFYYEITGQEPDSDTLDLFKEVLQEELLHKQEIEVESK